MMGLSLPPFGFTRAWREAARILASHRVPPEEVSWGDAGLFAVDPIPATLGPHPVQAPKSFTALSAAALAHRDPEAPSLCYAALLQHQKDGICLNNAADPMTRRIEVLAKAVRRDIHKMHAFVRFKEVDSASNRRRFGAWFEPDNHIEELAAPFFVKRFADMDWVIATPRASLIFNGDELQIEAPPPGTGAPANPDEAEELWRTYYANIFNPARVKLAAMRSEMPKKYWKNLPETSLIPDMLEAAEGRVQAMREAMPTEPPKRAEKILRRQKGAPLKPSHKVSSSYSQSD